MMVERNVINESPIYQRESGAWSTDKKQLFLDSLFNNYDIPKIYFHDLRGIDSRYDYAVIDGKQRLNAIWIFLNDQLSLGEDFSVSDCKGRTPPQPGTTFSKLDQAWQELFKSRTLDVVLVQNANEDDIEELFSRLNNGEPLNAAEKRNAMGGAMCALIRKVAQHKFFAEKVRFPNSRSAYFEVAAKLLLIEAAVIAGGDMFVSLQKRYLDDLVRTRRDMSDRDHNTLYNRVDETLQKLSRIFLDSDPLLGKQAYLPMYYLFAKVITRDYAHAELFASLKAFLPSFQALRQKNLEADESECDPTLIEFGRLIQQGTNKMNSLRERVEILRRYFLLQYCDTKVKDPVRSFNTEERYAVWVIGGKRCAICKCDLATLDEMQSDHKTQWAHGGETTIKNARALCESCNQEQREKVR